MGDAPLPAGGDPVFLYPYADAIWRYTLAAGQYAPAIDPAVKQASAQLARQAALDLAKVTKDAEGAAAWIEIAEVWHERAAE
jgi:hypothetical protein